MYCIYLGVNTCFSFVSLYTHATLPIVSPDIVDNDYIHICSKMLKYVWHLGMSTVQELRWSLYINLEMSNHVQWFLLHRPNPTAVGVDELFFAANVSALWKLIWPNRKHELEVAKVLGLKCVRSHCKDSKARKVKKALRFFEVPIWFFRKQKTLSPVTSHKKLILVSIKLPHDMLFHVFFKAPGSVIYPQTFSQAFHIPSTMVELESFSTWTEMPWARALEFSKQRRGSWRLHWDPSQCIFFLGGGFVGSSPYFRNFQVQIIERCGRMQ